MLYLSNGFNVNVTPSQPCPGGFGLLSIVCNHSRPYRFYGFSISPDYLKDDDNMTADPIGSTANMGFDRSVERGSTLETLNSVYPTGSYCKVDGDTCLILATPWEPLTYFPSAFWETTVQAASGALDLVVEAGSKIKSFTLDVVGIISGSNTVAGLAALELAEDVLFTDGFEGGSGQSSETSAYLNMLVTTDGEVNVLRFNWSFSAQGEGILRVFVDGVLVRQIDQRHVNLASLETEEILISTPDGALPAGTHELVFRLDSFDPDNSASARITDVELGFYELVEAP